MCFFFFQKKEHTNYWWHRKIEHPLLPGCMGWRLENTSFIEVQVDEWWVKRHTNHCHTIKRGCRQ